MLSRRPGRDHINRRVVGVHWDLFYRDRQGIAKRVRRAIVDGGYPLAKNALPVNLAKTAGGPL